MLLALQPTLPKAVLLSSRGVLSLWRKGITPISFYAP